MSYHPDRLIHLFHRPDYAEAFESHADLIDEAGGIPLGSAPFDFLREDFRAELRSAGVGEVEIELVEENVEFLEGNLGRYTSSGRNIFDVSQSKEALSFPVDMTTVPKDLNLPIDDFYIHWGRERALASPHAGITVEGVYVSTARVRSPDPDFYTFDVVCEFVDPRGREELPLAQTIRRAARGFSFSLEPGVDTYASVLRNAGYGNEAMWSVWRDHADPAMRVALSALHFLIAKGFVADESQLSEPDDELHEMFEVATKNDSLQEACFDLMMERGISVVHKFL